VKRRHETNLKTAMFLSLAAHAGIVYVVASAPQETVASRAALSSSVAVKSADLEALLLPASALPAAEPSQQPIAIAKAVPPPPPPDEEFGDPLGRGTATHNSPGEKPMQARKATQDQPLLRQNPGAGRSIAVAPAPAIRPAPAKPNPSRPQPAPPMDKTAVAKVEPAKMESAKKRAAAKELLPEGLQRSFGVADGDKLVPPRLAAAPKPAQLPAPAPQPRSITAIAEKLSPLPAPTSEPAQRVAIEPPKTSPARTSAPIGKTAVALSEKPPITDRLADTIVRPGRGDEMTSPTAAPRPEPPPLASSALSLEPDVSPRPRSNPRPFAISDADPAPKADTESDAFSVLGSVVFQAGRTEARFGRRVKIRQRPDIDPLNRIDVITAAPLVQLRIDIDETGEVRKVDVYNSSGFSDTIDLPCVKAVYTWWIEPAKDRNGKPKRDSILLNISIR
jgi:hypothetical protein